jgi:hypothetical protein
MRRKALESRAAGSAYLYSTSKMCLFIVGNNQTKGAIMEYEITIRYSVDSDDTTVNDAISALLDNTLPYMVDNVSIKFDTTW